jgi:transposase
MPKKTKNVHYVNNAEFSLSVVNYVKTVSEAKENNDVLPIVPDDIAIRYTYREEMVMDAVENCLKAVENYNIDAKTRSGKPNAFAYFTQIIWFAFLRRITKEKKQQEIKEKYMLQSGVEAFITSSGSEESTQVATHFVDTLKDRISKVKEYDTELKTFAKANKPPKKRARTVDSDLQDFLE